MKNHLADRLSHQRNEALDREAVLYAELMAAQEKIAELEAQVEELAQLATQSPPPGVGAKRDQP